MNLQCPNDLGNYLEDPNQIDNTMTSRQRAQNRLFEFGLTANEGQKRPMYRFKSKKGLEIQS